MTRTGTPEKQGKTRGVWWYRAVLPAVEPVSLGEGWTPLTRSRCCPGVWWKDEGANPTGSVKARGASVAVSVARAAGAQVVRHDGGVDAGVAIAAYAAAAGLGAELHVSGELAAVDHLRLELGGGAEGGVALDEDAWEAGVGTLALEIVEQMSWKMPKAVIWAEAPDRALRALRTGFELAVDWGWVEGEFPELVRPGEQDGWVDHIRKVLLGDGLLLSKPGAEGAAAADQFEGEVVVINPRSGLMEGEQLARRLGVRALPGRMPVGGIITPQ